MTISGQIEASPQPLEDVGSAGREPAPSGGLRTIQDFVNTNDIEGGQDELATPELLRQWLVARGDLAGREPVSSVDHRRALDVREGLRALGLVNNDEPLEADRVSAMNRAAAQLPLILRVTDAQSWQLAPADSGVEGFLSNLLATLATSMADGSWSRMKACRNDTCRWLFYDHSRNRSGRWCTMAICGSRMKARAYRARRRTGEGPAGRGPAVEPA